VMYWGESETSNIPSRETHYTTIHFPQTKHEWFTCPRHETIDYEMRVLSHGNGIINVKNRLIFSSFVFVPSNLGKALSYAICRQST
jgi:hypothetical protein